MSRELPPNFGDLSNLMPDVNDLVGTTDRPTPGMQAIAALYDELGLPELGLVQQADYRNLVVTALTNEGDIRFVMAKNHPIATGLRSLAAALIAEKLGTTTINQAAEIIVEAQRYGDTVTTFSYTERLGTNSASIQSLTLASALRNTTGEHILVGTRNASGEVKGWHYLIQDDRSEAIQVIPPLVEGIATMEPRQIQTAVGGLAGVDGVFVTRAAQL